MIVLKKGSKNNDVKKLQQLLNITSDGVFGENTEKAVKLFQKINNLTPDGIVGEKTWALLLKKTMINNNSIDNSVIYKPLSKHITKLPNRDIKYLAIHFTAGSNSKQGKALSEYNTFITREASADFCVDDKDIVQFNPDLNNYYCWAVGDKGNNNNGGSLRGKATNKNTISIEICSTCKPATTDSVNKPNHKGWSFSEESLQNAIKLAKIIINKYNIPLENVIRHYDITGKLCPGIIGWNNELIYDINLKKYTSNRSDESEWIKFKNNLK